MDVAECIIGTGFVRTKNYENLAGVLLALTGSEVMFAKFVTPLS